MKHTNTPWTISYSGDGKLALINKGYVASVELDDNEDGEANANLISAAPDLLEALEALMSEIDKGNLVRDISQDHKSDWQVRQLPLYQCLSKVATAIKKAKGL